MYTIKHYFNYPFEDYLQLISTMTSTYQSEHRSANSANQPRMYDVGLLTSHDCC